MKQKAALCATVLLLAVLICGCTTSPGESTAAPAETPDLLGNWTGQMTGYEHGKGYTDYAGSTMTLRVTEQNGRIFSGEITFKNSSGYAIREATPCAGVIGRDGRALTLVEEGGGYSSGSIIAPEEIEFIYANGAEPFSIAIDSLKRS